MVKYKVCFILEDIEVGETELKLRGIKSVDETFKYGIYRMDNGKYILCVMSGSFSEAHRKGMWLRDKLFGNKKLYWVSDRKI